jgi:hypothetical protein
MDRGVYKATVIGIYRGDYTYTQYCRHEETRLSSQY